MKALARPLVVLLGLLVAWQLAVWISDAPRYILPGPLAVLSAFIRQAPLLLEHGAVTLSEILLGLLLGTLLGCSAALTLAYARSLRPWLLPLLVASQAVPVFAIAPLLVLWLGYGIASKVAMATLIIFFPVTAAFFDGLKRAERGWLDLAQVMGASPARRLWLIQAPAALPALASGLRVATAVAPIGAIVGEWVGSSAGLGYFMLQANARLQVDAVFAALFLLALMAVLLYYSVDRLARLAVPWQSEAADS
jgi:putative hydroxymethylpyrimidine transport system permease protein